MTYNTAPPSGYRYLVVSDGTTVSAYSAITGGLVISGTDGGAVLTAILPAAASAGATIDFRNDGNVFPWRTMPLLPKGITGKLLIRGHGSIVQAAVSAGRQFLGFNRTADYDTFQNIDVEGFVFDRNSFTNASSEHVFFGNLVNGGWSQRLNFKGITVRRCKTINVPVGATGLYQHISIVSTHLASNEATQTSITDILIEDCDWQGGNTGTAIMGSGTYTAGLGVNVYHDRITLNRVKHDRGVTPTAFSGDANIQIGGVGFGGTVRTRDCYCANSGDVGIEIDAIQDYVDDGSTIVDSWTAKRLSRNFRAPVDVNSQVNQWKNGTSLNINLDRATAPSIDYYINGDTTTAGYIFGTLIFDGKSLDSKSTIAGTGSGCFLNLNNVQFKKVVGSGTYSMTALNVTAGALTFNIARVLTPVVGAEIDLDLTTRLAGARSGTGTNGWKIVNLNGTDFTAKVRSSVDVSGFTGLTTASDTFYYIGVGMDSSSTARLEVLTPRCIAAHGATQGSHNGIYMNNLTVAGPRGTIDKIDTGRAPAGAGFDVYGQATPTMRSKVQIVNPISLRAQNASQSNSGPLQNPTAVGFGSGTGDTTNASTQVLNATGTWYLGMGITGTGIPAGTYVSYILGTTLTLSVAATATATGVAIAASSPTIYRNLDMVSEMMAISGGTVTLVEWSQDGTTWYTVGTSAGAYRVDPGEFLRITYSVAPTLTKRPLA